jgi:UDP-GlcNAc3NAcA epimerase
MKIARIVGARPQFMQLPAVIAAILRAGHDHVLIHTGQHYDREMSENFFKELCLPQPDINLNVGSGTHGAATGRMIECIETALREVKPDLVMVDGDTNSTLAGALAAVKIHIPVVHIEAGLRDFDRRRPEEINRIMADHASDLNCAPIPRALVNLEHESLGGRSVLTGDVLLDCYMMNWPRRSMAARERLGLKAASYNVMTLHRPENTDQSEYWRFKEIMSVVTTRDKPVILPVHPRTRPILNRYIADGHKLGSLRPCDTVSYLEMLGLLDGCECVFSDSGGLPREAVWSGKRCVMLFRTDTWHDLLKNCWATIGRTDSNSIEAAYFSAKAPDVRDTQAFFGNGQSADRVIEAINRLVV